ncbi:uncharacterized protein LOC128771354 isoform X2 [Synchiropus splendidus]|uniref:uncharacterized protein LOC128771354 isoform X2 n=1 Tax=Synchiropus splendidus TaxID=270530 RepID=UPI00237DA07E|nr:uncharacterized protein LOC128771354 isoform X2 [Synchiropus splendidus]
MSLYQRATPWSCACRYGMLFRYFERNMLLCFFKAQKYIIHQILSVQGPIRSLILKFVSSIWSCRIIRCRAAVLSSRHRRHPWFWLLSLAALVLPGAVAGAAGVRPTLKKKFVQSEYLGVGSSQIPGVAQTLPVSSSSEFCEKPGLAGPWILPANLNLDSDRRRVRVWSRMGGSALRGETPAALASRSGKDADFCIPIGVPPPSPCRYIGGKFCRGHKQVTSFLLSNVCRELTAPSRVLLSPSSAPFTAPEQGSKTSSGRRSAGVSSQPVDSNPSSACAEDVMLVRCLKSAASKTNKNLKIKMVVLGSFFQRTVVVECTDI